MTVDAAPSSGGILSFRWYRAYGETGSEDDFELITVATDATYNPNTSELGTTRYRVVVTNTYGAYSASRTLDLTLRVDPRPADPNQSVVINPINQIVNVGQPFTLTAIYVANTGDDVAFSWYKRQEGIGDGRFTQIVPLVNTVSMTLYLNTPGTFHFQVTFSNSTTGTTVESMYVTVTVESPPAIGSFGLFYEYNLHLDKPSYIPDYYNPDVKEPECEDATDTQEPVEDDEDNTDTQEPDEDDKGNTDTQESVEDNTSIDKPGDDDDVDTEEPDGDDSTDTEKPGEDNQDTEEPEESNQGTEEPEESGPSTIEPEEYNPVITKPEIGAPVVTEEPIE
jgi:hypothetical protein